MSRTSKQINEDAILGSKICNSCNTRKDFDDFQNMKGTCDTKHLKCKVCVLISLKDRKDNSRSEVLSIVEKGTET